MSKRVSKQWTNKAEHVLQWKAMLMQRNSDVSNLTFLRAVKGAKFTFFVILFFAFLFIAFKIFALYNITALLYVKWTLLTTYFTFEQILQKRCLSSQHQLTLLISQNAFFFCLADEKLKRCLVMVSSHSRERDRI